ncbi:Peptidyl-prolyl cis-trans isomerase-like 2 [Staphylotrichum longicolle]|uniref:Peptidyl-prolyl cis-trans isomerase-like 2 n=1 Tax=Staphylotrichum longicolle TaxID=669026 RepID=A0AAD4EZG0_9PEZI|nr:Peptidyl-prolyl cis-trans isomerase-like 2 [Staphylotrichum longicolle]
MGKGTDKLYITHSEWSSSDAYSASTGANAGARAQRNGGSTHASFKRLPFNFCAASLQPFKNPVCTPSGTIFDVEIISAWLEKKATNPVTGEPLAAKDLIRLNFARNADTADDTDRNGVPTDGKGDFIDPVTFKVLTDNTHIVAIRHGNYANVFAWETVERMNIKAKMWRDLVDDVEFTRKDIITLQDPQNAASRDLSQFKYLQDGQDALSTPEQDEQRQQGSINIDALGRIGDKVLRAKEAVARARNARSAGGDINRTTTTTTKTSTTTPRAPAILEKKLAPNAASYTTGLAAASFTSTGLTPSTSNERALLSDEEWMLHPKRIKHKGYARLETNLGPLTLELHTETAPKAVWNFLRLAQRGYYASVPFHRSIRNFMIQGGDPTGTGRGGQSVWGKNFADELEGPHVHDARGVLSMANKGKNTNSSQFFITYRAAKHLDRKHTVFGRVVEGADTTLARMEGVPVEEGTNRPLDEIRIERVVVLIDPFDEFLKEKKEKEAAGKVQEEVRRAGGTEDDRTTWTGKRIRADGVVEEGDEKGAKGVGKYLKAASAAAAAGTKPGEGGEAKEEEVVETWEEPVRKKVKTGGFGNFDSW